jgi:hypothetical protein
VRIDPNGYKFRPQARQLYRLDDADLAGEGQKKRRTRRIASRPPRSLSEDKHLTVNPVTLNRPVISRSGRAPIDYL